MDLQRIVADQWVVLGEHTMEKSPSGQLVPVATWTPDPAMIAEIAPVLMTELQRRLDDLNARRSALTFQLTDTRHPQHTSEYFVQCVGRGHAGGRSVLLNGLHQASMPSHYETWRSTLVRVCDGFAHYFCAAYDPATKQLVWFRFNGLGLPPRDYRDVGF